MGVRANWLKSWVNSLVILSSALFAHHLVGGMLISLHQLLSIILPTLVALTLLNLKPLDGPRLALLILVVQSFSHIVLGGMSDSSRTMAIAHLSTSIISYAYIRFISEFWPAHRLTLRSLFKEYLSIFPRRTRSRVISWSPSLIKNNAFDIQTFSWRGPPLSSSVN